MPSVPQGASESLVSLVDRLQSVEDALYRSREGSAGISHNFSLVGHQVPPSPHRQLANPSPLGLFGFAIVSTLAAVPKISGDPSAQSNGLLAITALFLGGLAQVIAAIFQFLLNNVHSATTFALFGLHWSTQGGLLLIASVSEISTASGRDSDALAVYYAVLTAATIALWIPTFRMNRVLNVTLGIVIMIFALDIPGAYEYRWAEITSGVLAVIASTLAVYMALLDLVNETWKRGVLPLFPHKEHREDYSSEGIPYIPRRTFHKSAVSSVHI